MQCTARRLLTKHYCLTRTTPGDIVTQGRNCSLSSRQRGSPRLEQVPNKGRGGMYVYRRDIDSMCTSGISIGQDIMKVVATRSATILPIGYCGRPSPVKPYFPIPPHVHTSPYHRQSIAGNSTTGFSELPI